MLMNPLLHPQHPVVQLPGASSSVPVQVQASDDLSNLGLIGLIPDISGIDFRQRFREKLSELPKSRSGLISRVPLRKVSFGRLDLFPERPGNF